MSKERYNQIIDEVYWIYLIEDAKILPNMSKEKMTEIGLRLTKDEFINKIKTDKGFSDRWGLKIEERELSLDERYQLALPIWKEKYGLLSSIMIPSNVDNTPYKIPTKQITLDIQRRKNRSL
jgi:hypothetical protein